MPHHRRAQGQAPCLAPASAGGGGLYEDTSRTHPGSVLPAPGLSASVTSQLSLHPSINPRRGRPRQVAQSSPNVAQPRPTAGRCRWYLSVQLRCACRPAKFCFAGGGGERIRTDDLLLAKQALSRLSYTPVPEDRLPQTGTAESLPFRVCAILPSGWWAREDLNLRPHAYQARALTS